MKIPKRIQPLIDDGIVDQVISRLKSGKEADVFMVRCNDEIMCAKVYKEVAKRSFKQAVHYQEGRKTRNSRDARAMIKGSKFGRKQEEERWHNAEVDALYLLANAGVRVPKPYICQEGVLLMELITDDAGNVAPRLGEVTLTKEEALRDYAIIIKYIVQMLCVGLVHGDLSEFNVLMDAKGPVIIDLPQAVDAAANNHAQKMFERDVNNMTHYYAQFAPELLNTRYAKEIWALYSAGELDEESVLTGLFEEHLESANVGAVLDEIVAVEEEHKRMLEAKASREREEREKTIDRLSI